MRGGEEEDHQSRDFYELCALLLSILRHPPLPLPSVLLRASPRRMDISPAGFASLLLGISFALMLCGSVTFFVGFILMPWVFGFVMVFYLVGLVSNLSMLGRAIMVRNLSVVGPGGSMGRMDMPDDVDVEPSENAPDNEMGPLEEPQDYWPNLTEEEVAALNQDV